MKNRRRAASIGFVLSVNALWSVPGFADTKEGNYWGFESGSLAGCAQRG